jgi:hypothetical protein
MLLPNDANVASGSIAFPMRGSSARIGEVLTHRRGSPPTTGAREPGAGISGSRVSSTCELVVTPGSGRSGVKSEGGGRPGECFLCRECEAGSCEGSNSTVRPSMQLDRSAIDGPPSAPPTALRNCDETASCIPSYGPKTTISMTPQQTMPSMLVEHDRAWL